VKFITIYITKSRAGFCAIPVALATKSYGIPISVYRIW